MTTPRLVVGTRANGDTGVFMSPPSVNAMTAADALLLLNISTKVSQLILLGSVASSQLISLGLSSQPIVFLTQYALNNIVGVNGTSTFPVGPMRPSPVNPGDAGASVTINSGGASMTISTSGATTYAVYSKSF